MRVPAGFIRLTQLPRELADVGYDCRDLTYHQLWRCAVEGRYAAWRFGGVWHSDANADNLKAIAAVFNLPVKKPRLAEPSGRASQPAVDVPPAA
jgi:hypothetical protein